MRKFEKISFDQFKKDIKDDKDLYNEYIVPKRNTKASAGYDFYAIEDYVIKPNETLVIPTGIKVIMNPDEMLMIVVRSSSGFKYNVRMCNQVGVIDSDYYNNDSNEGHMWVALKNEGDEDYIINKGDAYCQGIFIKYLTVGDEVSSVRTGGIGSTNKESE